MKNETKCTVLAESLAGDADLQNVRAHVAQCADCTAVAERCQALADELRNSPAADPARRHRTVAAAERLTVRLQRISHALLAAVCAAAFAAMVILAPRPAATRPGLVLLGMLVFGGAMAVVRTAGVMRPRSGRVWAVVALLIAILFVSTVRQAPVDEPATLTIAIATTLLAALAGAVLAARGPLYKRLYHGRMLSGVCQGLAQELGVSVTWVRLLFVALMFLQLGGLFLYLMLDAAMQVHPDDRVHMWRFRVARWFRRGAPAAA